ncbi:hypothetical protein M1P56_21220 [Streptomyces sp. HU2014]|uniref:Uncharacterized protein n=1 Tax=Streptomyces albireticuli TaxID=1940 RepID=A0A1Z2KWQ6_9ACTN|nr:MULTISPECIES: hypothetical protein [Streptomyces]ARZ66475.1 hypothetical protein SMD11_0809 [Streptomyces albireticuli]UQI46689.1 hypothetical protein M1P56_21220 [Streptomyces sp. HU2014]
MGSLRLPGTEEAYGMAELEDAAEGAAEAPEESGGLLLEQRDGVLVLRLTGGGSVIPKAIPVVDGAGRLLAVYSAGTAVRPAPGGERGPVGDVTAAVDPLAPVADTFEVDPPR